MTLTYAQVEALVNASEQWLENLDDFIADDGEASCDAEDLQSREILGHLLPRLNDYLEANKPPEPPGIEIE